MHNNLQMIIAVGFKANNDNAVQFHKWAILTDLLFII
ncbi:MAG: virulence RhuM family protein [Defluviitaleaceae bacterium]|nr:virulence RhuM family protein [Defluviitaleaceae bacterium]